MTETYDIDQLASDYVRSGDEPTRQAAARTALLDLSHDQAMEWHAKTMVLADALTDDRDTFDKAQEAFLRLRVSLRDGNAESGLSPEEFREATVAAFDTEAAHVNAVLDLHKAAAAAGGRVVPFPLDDPDAALATLRSLLDGTYGVPESEREEAVCPSCRDGNHQTHDPKQCVCGRINPLHAELSGACIKENPFTEKPCACEWRPESEPETDTPSGTSYDPPTHLALDS